MRSFAKMSIAFFLLCLLILGFVYVFGPDSIRQGFQPGENPVGQRSTDDALTTPGQPNETK